MWRDAWNASEEVCWNIAITFWNGWGRVRSSMTPYEFSRHGHLVHSRRKLSMYAFSWMHSSNAKQLHYDKILVTQWYRIGVLSVMDKFICHLLLAIFLILFEASVDYSSLSLTWMSIVGLQTMYHFQYWLEIPSVSIPSYTYQPSTASMNQYSVICCCLPNNTVWLYLIKHDASSTIVDYQPLVYFLSSLKSIVLIVGSGYHGLSIAVDLTSLRWCRIHESSCEVT